MNSSLTPLKPPPSWSSSLREVATRDDIAQYLRVLWRNRWPIGGLTLLIIIATLVLLAFITPQYTATSKVMIDTRRTRITDAREVISQLTPQLVTVMSEVEVVRSRNVLNRVADALNLWSDPTYNPALRPQTTSWLRSLRQSIAAVFSTDEENEKAKELAAADPAERAMQAVARNVAGRLSVTPIPQSLVMQISFTSPDPRQAALIADAFAEQYVLDQLENKFEAARQAAGWLSSRLEALRNAVQVSERAVAEYKSQSNLLDMRAGQPAQQQLTELNSQLILAQAKRAELEARVTRIEAAIKSNDPGSAMELVVDSPLIQRIKEQETQLAREISDLATRYREQHPRMVKAVAEQDELRRKLLIEISKLGQGLRSDLLVTRSRETGLREQIRKIEETIHRQGRAGIRLNELERELASNRLIYETFLQRSKETSEQQQAQQPDARVISRADIPNAPSAPKRALFLSAAALLGIILGSVLVLLIEAMRNTFVSRDQLEHASGVPALGAIPLIGRREEVAEYVLKKPNSAFAESLRSIWVALKHSGRHQMPRVIAITSAMPGEGKSVTALALARTVAVLGNKTALVDCDLRRSSLTKNAGLKPSRYIDEILHGKANLQDVVIHDKAVNLDIYPGRNLATPPLDLFSSEAMRDFIEQLRGKYDLVIIDCPPVLPVSDTHVLSRLSDAVLFLVQWDQTPKDAVRSGLRMLDEVGAPLAGMLLTQINMRKQARYGYGDSTGYYGRYKAYYTD
jgi:succinoglycan biosynthesis transport protein ExoP